MAADGMAGGGSATNQVLLRQPCGGYQLNGIGHDGQATIIERFSLIPISNFS
jgi:hypothetical protein